MSVKIPIISPKMLDRTAVQCPARVSIEMGAPVMRPLSAVPGIERVLMVDMYYAGTPVVIHVDVIKADVPVIIAVVPSPSKRPPPGMTPRPQPDTRSKSETESHLPIIHESNPKSIRAGPADPVGSDVRRIVPTCAVNHHTVRTDFRA